MVSSDQPSKSSEKLQDLSEEIIRRQSALKLFFDFPASGFGELLVASLKKVIEVQGLNASESFGAMDLYGRPWQDVQQLLKSQHTSVSPMRVNAGYSPQNFKNTAWTINSGDSVTLLHDGDRVVGVKRGIQQESNPDNHDNP